MPKIPLYKRRAQLPRSTNLYLENVEAAGRTGREIQRAGKDLLARAEDLRKERDEVDALAAVEELTDFARKTEFEQKKLKGPAARGAYENTGKALDEKAQQIREGLSDGAAEIFDKDAFQVRKSTMDAVSHHEIQEHHNAKVGALKSLRTRFRTFIKGGDRSKQSRDEYIAGMKERTQSMYKGYPKEFVKGLQEQYKSEMVKEWLVERANRHPEKVIDELDDYEDMLGAKQIELIKGVLHERVTGELARETFETMRIKHKGDHVAMMREAKNIKTPLLREAVKDYIKTDLGDTIRLQNYVRGKAQEEALKDISDKYDAAIEGIPGAMSINELQDYVRDTYRSTLDKEQYTSVMSQLRNTTAKSIAGHRNENSDFYLDHPRHETAIEDLISRRGYLMKESMITQAKLAGAISIKEEGRLKDALKTFQRKGPQKLQNAFLLAKEWRKNDAWGESKNPDEPKEMWNERHYLSLRGALRSWYMELDEEEYEKANPIDDFMLPYMKPIRAGNIAAAYFRSIKHVEEKYGLPDYDDTPDNEMVLEGDFDEEQFLIEQFGDIARPDYRVIEPPKEEVKPPDKPSAYERALDWLNDEKRKQRNFDAVRKAKEYNLFDVLDRIINYIFDDKED